MRKWNRRTFAKGVGLATLFSPFLRYFDPAHAQGAPGPAKYLFIFFTNGTEPSVWKPGGGAGSIQHSQMTEPLAPLNSNLVLIDNLNSNGTANSHAAPGGLTGSNYGSQDLISLDQFASDKLRELGVVTQIPNLVLGGVSNEQPTTFYRKNSAFAPISSVSAAYGAIFGGSGTALPGDTGDTGESAADAFIRRRESVLDALTSDINQLKDTLGVEERAKLEAHAESIRQLEDRLAQQREQQANPDPIAVSCATPASPGNGGDDLANSVLHMDLAIKAFSCDLTRVAAVQFGHHQSTQVNIAEVGAPGDWHNGFMHSDNPRTRLVNMDRWLAKQFVAAAEQLKSTPAPDGNGSLFDQTLMLWARDMGDAVAHDGSNMRFTLSGGAGGYLRGGSYINGAGEAHAKILFNALEALGITDTAGFSDPAGDRSPLASIRA